jgi:TonB family protein
MERTSNHNSCLTRNDILAYCNNQLDADNKQAMEIHLQTCQLCKDALDGFKGLTSNEMGHAINDLDQKFNNYLTKENTVNKSSYLTISLLAVSAAAAVAAIFTIIQFMDKPISTSQQSTFDFSVDLSTNVEPPDPPAISYDVLKKSDPDRVASTSKTSKSTEKDDIGTPKIMIQRRKPIHETEVKGYEKPHKIPNTKTVEKKILAEANIIIPGEMIRYGYSHSDKVITIQFDSPTNKSNSAQKTLPSFQNKGIDGFVNYIAQNIEYPEDARLNGIEGTVVVQFTVEKNGRLSNVHVVNKVHPSLDFEALKTIKSSPIWFPGTINHQPASVQLSCPVSFVIQ